VLDVLGVELDRPPIDAGLDLAAGGEQVSITAMECDLSRAFRTDPNRVLSRDRLPMQTRHREWDPFERSIDIRIGRQLVDRAQ
jgi:DNA-binding response OmpR family regulator